MIKQNEARPNPRFAPLAKIETAPFELISDAQRVRTAWLEEEDAFRKNELADLGQSLEERGMAVFHVKGRVFTRLSATMAFRMQDHIQGARARFIEDGPEREQLSVDDENGEAVPVSVSESLITHAALIATVIHSIEGGDVYSMDDLIVMATTMEELFIGLLDIAQSVKLGKLTATPPQA